MYSKSHYQLGQLSPMMAPNRNNASTGIYVHFPYCIQKCSYCDFFSIGMESEGGRKTVSGEALKQFEQAIAIELDARLPMFEQYASVNTIYFGGGTSSLMPPDTIDRILSLLRARFTLTSDCEITLEGNPENFSLQYLQALYEIGITRVNVGIQTFSGQILREMNRYFNEERYRAILSDLEASPIKNVGVDLIYGFPGQEAEDFYADLNRVLSVNLNHLSIYSLTAEPGTPYATSIERTRMSAPNEDLQFKVFSDLPGILGAYEFRQYEISNFAKPGGQCRHNERYWLYESYMGLGPGAHGFTGTHRYSNTRNLPAWTREPAAAQYEKHNPIYDLPLNILRLMTPIDSRIFGDVLGDVPGGSALSKAAAELFQYWVERGWGRWYEQEAMVSRAGDELFPRMFVWNFDGYARLNERTLEMIDAFETIR